MWVTILLCSYPSQKSGLLNAGRSLALKKDRGDMPNEVITVWL